MIDVKKYHLEEVVDRHHVQSFQSTIRYKAEHIYRGVPPEVRQFVEAVAMKLGDFAQYGRDREMIKGEELLLCGLKEWQGEKIFSFAYYSLEIPKMQAVDNVTAMLRIYHKRGKQGLINYCKFRVKGSDLERLLDVLNVHVFHEEREEFKKVMSEIRNSKKLDTL